MDTSTPSPLPPPGSFRPKSSTPKVLGILNIIFGSVLILFGLCSALSLIVNRAMAPFMTAQQNQMRQVLEAKQQADRAAELRKLDEEEEAAQTEEEKQSIQTQRQAIESAPVVTMPVMPDMSKMYGMNDGRVLAFMVTDTLSGVLLNILFIVSGAGLVAMKEWARKMALGVAVAKLVRLVVMQGCNLIFILPIMAKQMSEGMDEMMSQMPTGPGAAPPPQFGAQFAMMMGGMMSAGVVCMVVFGAIYPILLLWFLTRPDAKAACQATSVETRAG